MSITVTILIGLVVLFILILVPILINQGKMVFSQIPSLAGNIQNTVNSFLSRVGSNVFLDIGDNITQMFSGAGDAFNGGFATALARGDGPVDAVRFGCVTAGISVTRRGTATAMPTLAEVEDLMERSA